MTVYISVLFSRLVVIGWQQCLTVYTDAPEAHPTCTACAEKGTCYRHKLSLSS